MDDLTYTKLGQIIHGLLEDPLIYIDTYTGEITISTGYKVGPNDELVLMDDPYPPYNPCESS